MTNAWTGGQYSAYRFLLGAWLAVHFPGALGVAGLALGACLALGVADRFAAVGLAALAAWRGELAVAFLPLLHAFAPGAPFGSLAARGRSHPGGGWRLPDPVVWAARLALVAVVFALLLRPAAELAIAAAFLAALGLDPGWLAPRRDAEPATLFYDGDCGLCHRAVRFVLAEDRDGRAFRFAPLASELFAGSLPAAERAALPDSLVVRTPEGRFLVRTAAVREICMRLGGLWGALALASHALPERWLDRGYDQIARMRSRLFARPAEACPLVPPELRQRFH